MKKSVFVLTAVVSVLLLAGCEDLSVLAAQLDDEVKLANDRYLEVVETFPEQNDQNLSPKIELLVTLDRDIDPETIKPYLSIEQRDSDGTITEFGESSDVTEELELEFSAADKTLSIRPSPFWAGGDKITVSLLPGATALDGSVLRDIFSWSFYTVKVPVGTIEFVDGPNAQPGYSPDNTPDVNIAFSNAGEYYLDWDKTFIDDISSNDLWGWESTSVKSGEEFPTNAAAFPLGDDPRVALPEGLNTIYAIFKDPSTNTLSDPVSDTVFVDTISPVVDSFADVTIRSNDTLNRTATYSDSNFYSVLWSSSNGAVFGSPTSLTTTIRGPSGGYVPALDIKATVFDKAGNSGETSFTYYWDNEPPNRPNIASKSSSSIDLVFNWSSGGLGTDDSSGGFSSVFGYVLITSSNYLLKPRIQYGTWSVYDNSTSRTGIIPVQKGDIYPPVGHYLIAMRVMERDSVGNTSSYDTEQVGYTEVRPSNGTTTVPNRGTVFIDWPDYFAASRPSYTLYLKYGTLGKYISYSTSATSNSLRSLSTSGTYYWYYKENSTGYTSPVFNFRI